MRRENRKKQRNMNILYISGIVLGLAIIAFVITFIVYGNKLNKEAQNSMLSSEKIADLVPSVEISEEASSEFGKTVEESKEEIKEETTTPEPIIINNKVNATSEKQEVENKELEENIKDKKEETAKTEAEVSEKVEEVKEPVFERPVEGEIIKKFAKDTLVYSETLDEWVVHNGIDIKAEKTTVVKAAEAGTIKAIKNDPRYGLTIVIQHNMDYVTVYSNLLTSEFVVEGEAVEKGQSIGTVGNTATFEIADEPHLHFEIQKGGEVIDPSNYIE